MSDSVNARYVHPSYIAAKKRINAQIDRLFALKAPCIDKRNTILDSAWKTFFPIYQKRLKEIDERLDEIDIQIYAFERVLYDLKLAVA